MAKKKTSGNATPTAEGETTAGYFRRVFKEHPRMLKERSNDKLLERWLTDHPGHTEVPQSVKNNLANIKSVLRSKKRKKKKVSAEAPQPGTMSAAAPPVRPRMTSGHSRLEELESQIDECLSMAKHLDREGLHDVIGNLRRARNAVVWKLGQ
jgi:hypothetical protein